MKYKQLISILFDSNSKHKSSTITLYLFIFSRFMEKEKFEGYIYDSEISNSFKITNKTITTSRIELKELNLLDFQTKKGAACFYRIKTEWPNEIRDKINIKQASTTTPPLPSLQKQSKQVFNKPQIPKAKVKTIPSFEEFMVFAKQLPDYHSKMDLSIEGKYETWVANDWKNGHNRPIINWKAALKSSWSWMISNSLSAHSLTPNKIPNITRPKQTYDED